MADSNQQTPDFTAMAENLRKISRAHASLATHFERMRNIPAFDAGERILEAIAALSRQMDERFDSMDRRFDRMGCRSNPRNQDVDFPEDGAAVDAMDGPEINWLLGVYYLPVSGDLASRRKRLKKFLEL